MIDPAWLALAEALDLTPLTSSTPEGIWCGARDGWPIELRLEARLAVVRIGEPGDGRLHLSPRAGRTGGLATDDPGFDHAACVGGSAPPLERLNTATRRRILPALALGARLTEAGVWWSLTTPPRDPLAGVDAILAALTALGPPDAVGLVRCAAAEPPAIAAAAARRLDAGLRDLGPPDTLAAALRAHRPPGHDRWLACLAPFEGHAAALAACGTPLAAAARAALHGDPDRPDAAARLAAIVLEHPADAIPACWAPIFESQPSLLVALLAAAPPTWSGWIADLTLDASGRAARLRAGVRWHGPAAAEGLLVALEGSVEERNTATHLLAGLIVGAGLAPRVVRAIGWHAEVIAAVDPRRIDPQVALEIHPQTTAARLAWARLAEAAPRAAYEPRLLALLRGRIPAVVDAALVALVPCATAASRPVLSALDHPVARAIVARLDPSGRLSDADVTAGELMPPR